ncbi:polyprotein [Blueberry leaf mottle virus]|uniref:RNA1 polyprotein n=1 Tax=Blueberry leaf mottle virus TaxID=38172 RepID=A0A8G0YIA3_9SECO|nr:polyprotein [Blueberry leaf mottle virus]QYY47938.1 polyprotein [Blueberry leaf mottle virus]
MASRTIGSVTLRPRFLIEESRLIRYVLTSSSTFAVTFLAQGASLKPTVVARAIINGVVAIDTVNFGFTTANGEPLTWAQTARVVRQFQLAHTKFVAAGLRQFNKKVDLSAKRFALKKSARIAAGVRRSCKTILASLDADLPCNGRQRRAIIKAHREATVLAAQKSEIFKKIRADKRAERARARLQAEALYVPAVRSIRTSYICPLKKEEDEPCVVRGRSFERTARRSATSTLSSSPPPRVRSPYESELFVLESRCRQAASLDLPPEVKHFFFSAADISSSVAHFEAISCLASYVCKYYARFPIPAYFAQLRTLSSDSSIKNVIRLSSSLHGELMAFDQIFKNDQIANGMGAFVAGLATGAVAAVSAVKVGAGALASAAKSAIDYGEAAFDRCSLKFVGTVGQATQQFGDTLLNLVYAQFDKCFAHLLSPFTHARDIIANYWRAVREWIKKMWGNLSIEIQALFDSTWWALALIVVSGLVMLTEKLLVSLGVLSHVGAITTLFMTGFMAYLGWNLASEGDSAESTLLRTIHALVHAVLDRAIGSGSGADLNANAPNILEFPLRILETLGTGLISAPLGTLQYMGKYGQAMDQIRKGKDAMKEFIGFIFDRMSDAWDYMSGRKDTFFREISSMTKVQIVPWIEKSQKLVLEAQTVAVTDPVLMDTVTHLLYQGHVLQSTLAGAKRTTSLDYGRVVSALVVELTKVRAQCARAGIFEGRRCEPFWVYLYGPSHCGKSLFMEDVSRRLLKDNGHAPNDIYAKNARDSYWSGYLRQACVQIDDLSACVTEPSVESEFLQTIGSKDYKLNMAAVEDKGMSFNSSIFVTTSNVFTAPTDAKILDKMAYNNRRGAVVQCRRAPGVEFSARHPSLSCEGRLVNIQDETPITEWMNCSKILEQVSQMNAVHRDKELTLMCNYRERNELLHPIHDGAKNFLKNCTKSLIFDSIACDGKLYIVDKVTRTVEEAKEAPNPGLENSCLFIMDSMKTEIDRNARSGMLNTFLYSLLEGPCEVESVDKLSAGATDGQKTFFKELPLFERVYLRLVQKRIEYVKGIPELAFKVDIKAHILQSLATGYKEVCAHGGKILTVVAALVLILILYSTFFSIFSVFIRGDQSGMATLATMGALSANAGSVSTVYSSSEGSRASYSTRNPPIQYRSVGGSTYSANSAGKDEFLMNLLVWLETPGGGLTSAIRGKGRFLYLTKHQAEAIPNGARVECVSRLQDGSVRAVRIIWDSKNIREYAGTEAVTYHDATLSPLPEPHKAAFDVDIEALPTLFDMNVVVVKRKSTLRHVDPSLQALPAEQPIIDRWSSNGKLNRTMQSFNTFAYGGMYRNEIPISICSKCPTYAEDCGAMLTTMWKGQRRVIGMHVASGYKDSSMKDWTSTATLLPTTTDLTCNSGISMVEEKGCDYPGYRKLGWIPKMSDRPYITGRTMFEPVPEELKYQPTNLVETFSDGTERKVEVEIKQPAILTPTDSRIPAGMKYDPLVQGMEKFKQPMDLLDDGLCAEIASDIAESWHDCMDALEDTTDDVAINGAEDEFFDKFNMQTSEGYPWVKQRGIGQSGKSRYFEEAGDGSLIMKRDTPVYKAYNDLQEISRMQVPELICIETPKDECLPLRKITVKPKTRLFSILPLEFNLLLRKKFLSFAANLQQNRDKLPTQVGVDPYSREWGHIFSRLRSKNSVAINCDYASFDGLITAQILRHIGNAINSMYKDDDASKKQRHNMLMAIVNRKSICGSQVYEVSAGIPSGCALTVLLNSIFNELLIRYVWKTTVVGVPREMFSSYVTLIVYGDDNLISVHPEFLPYFNGMVIQKKLKDVGVTITDGSDKTAEGIYEKPFEKLDFLKRRFAKQSDGTVLAPLDVASIFTSLQNVTLGAGSIPAAVKQNVHSALIELYLHQRPEWFDDLRSFYVRGQGWTDLFTWQQARAFHREHMTGVLPWAPHRMLDIPVEKTKLTRAMANQGEADYKCQVAERIFVCGPKSNLSQEPAHFVVSHTGSLKRGETGIVAPVDFVSEGQGRLPTQMWVKKFRSESHTFRVMINDAYTRGHSIYFRSDPPYITNWLSATSFALGKGMDYKAILGLYHNVCTPDAQCLDEYFVSARFRRVDAYRPPHITNRY